jgi:hypothetical protein
MTFKTDGVEFHAILTRLFHPILTHPYLSPRAHVVDNFLVLDSFLVWVGWAELFLKR